ncbi:serine/threonine-protein kinase [Kamptonema formosum]|uniref:serine/threonine-protein kinase n=1 Tax=Kamptonema formosum TaxID=331992 RepID=UPI00034866D1|nr:serine/threonine-protein kinase [Oscillatoria sp. PCC 10802]
MSYCINPRCPNRQNPDNLANCQSCGTLLLVNNRYRLLKPLRELDEFSPTEIFEIDDAGASKVLKVLKRPKLSQMFEREARVLQQLKHPGIPQVEADGYFTVSPAGQGAKPLHCLVMEKIEGENLEQWLAKGGRITQTQALDWLIQLAEIIKLVHEKKIFHRDIKPSNIMLYPTGKLVLIDFGTVREVTGTYLAKVGSDRQITGIISPGYTPPEQATGKAVPQSDFFALGRTLVHLLTGSHPVDLGENPQTGELIWRELAPDVSPDFANLIDGLMAPFPGKRPADSQMVLQRLEQVRSNWQEGVSGAVDLRGTRWRGRKINPWGDERKPPRWLAATVLLLIGVWGFWGLGRALAVYYYSRGLENHLARQWEEAESNYKQALKLNPNYAEVHSALGFLCQNRQDAECARSEYEKAIALDPNLAIAHLNLGILCEDRQDWECAGTAYWQAARNGLPAAYNNLARLRILQQDFDAAAELLSQGLQLAKDPNTQYATLKNLGWAKLGQKRYFEAEETLRKAIELKGDRAPAYCLLAQVLESEHQPQNALPEWENCLRYASRYSPDEAAWIDMARERLNAQGEGQ